MSDFSLPLTPILDSIHIYGPTAFSFQGESFALPTEAEAEVKLRDLLYERCYMRSTGASRIPAGPSDNGVLLADLRLSNVARPRWQSGWRVSQTYPTGWISAARAGIDRTFAPGEYASKEGPGMPMRIGSTVDVYFAAESLFMQPGFYFAFGETVSEELDSAMLLRFYWHLEPAGAPLLLHSLSTLLNRFQVPYRFKCLAHPAAYLRADAAVLFVSSRWYQIAARLLRETWRAARPHLRPDCPLFTKTLAPGLALAEDPGKGQSFGMHRCTALASTICAIALTGNQLSLAEVTNGLAQRGISLISPYLNPGSVDTYEFLA